MNGTTTVDFAIEAILDALRQLIARRIAMPDDDPRVASLEEKLCIKSRALLARFVDCAMWEGVTPDVVDTVRKALTDTSNAVTVDKGLCRQSIDKRIAQFEEFLKRHPIE